jgi:hypothetical protein
MPAESLGAARFDGPQRAILHRAQTATGAERRAMPTHDVR